MLPVANRDSRAAEFTKSNELNENASLVYVVCLAIFAVSVRAGMICFRRWLAPWYLG